MVVFFTSTDPYIASRHGEKNGIEFEGTKKQCERYLLDLYNDMMDAPFASRICDAVRLCNKLNKIDGLSRSALKGHRLSFSYDSRVWEIMTKKEALA
jgi:hypothetical protein